MAHSAGRATPSHLQDVFMTEPAQARLGARRRSVVLYYYDCQKFCDVVFEVSLACMQTQRQHVKAIYGVADANFGYVSSPLRHVVCLFGFFCKQRFDRIWSRSIGSNLPLMFAIQVVVSPGPADCLSSALKLEPHLTGCVLSV